MASRDTVRCSSRLHFCYLHSSWLSTLGATDPMTQRNTRRPKRGMMGNFLPLSAADSSIAAPVVYHTSGTLNRMRHQAVEWSLNQQQQSSVQMSFFNISLGFQRIFNIDLYKQSLSLRSHSYLDFNMNLHQRFVFFCHFPWYVNELMEGCMRV